MEKKIWLNVGSGRDIKKSTSKIRWINIDRHMNNGADLKHQLPDQLPFKDGSIDGIYCSHVLEDFLFEYLTIMKDFHRVLKEDGLLHIKVPWGLSLSNPYHMRSFDETSFHCFVIDRTTSYECSGIPSFSKMLKLKINRVNPLRSLIYMFERGSGKKTKQKKRVNREDKQKITKLKESIVKFSDKLFPLKKFEVEVILKK